MNTDALVATSIVVFMLTRAFIGRRASGIASALCASGGLSTSARRAAPPMSRRVLETDEPVIVKMKALLAAAPAGTVSLAQGVVHWQPPEEALEAAREAVGLAPTHLYSADEGIPELRAALRASLASEHGLEGVEVMVTAGANQAFLNTVLMALNAGDSAVLFAPYYFNHLMALQMTGHADSILIGPAVSHDLLPDLNWLESQLERRNVGITPGLPAAPIRLVTLCTPGNPSGVNLPRAIVERAVALTARYGCFLYLDHAYAHFVHDGKRLAVCSAAHVLSCFSFSKVN
ncbi:pyridoxal phosphate-dependent transferase [Pavlovales sp. CCMP2436]|nr:pyridoxal phosphate-dependent transferase [Pavlovales sp. CCMP2436]